MKHFDEVFHFGRWLRDRILSLDMYPNKFIEILGLRPGAFTRMLKLYQAADFAGDDAQRLAFELGITVEAMEAAIERAWAELPVCIDDGYERQLDRRVFNVSVFRDPNDPRNRGYALPSEDGCMPDSDEGEPVGYGLIGQSGHGVYAMVGML